MLGDISALLLCCGSDAGKSSRGSFRDHCGHIADCIDAVHVLYAALSVGLYTVAPLDSIRLNPSGKLPHDTGTPDHGLGRDAISIGKGDGIAVITCYLCIEQYFYTKITQITLGILRRFFG